MKFIVEFYKELDTVNLILFWGIIIVIILLLAFSIIISIKNRKLKTLLKEKTLNDESNISHNDDIPIIKEENINVTIKEESAIENNSEPIKEDNYSIEEEKPFIAEEHVMEYNKDVFSLPNIKKVTETPKYEPEIKEEKTYNSPAPYQKNVLREMSLNQTSPIGIIGKEEKSKKEYYNAKDLSDSLNEDNHIDTFPRELPIEEETDDIYRTEYELQQEKDAIISYNELMKKKDSINIVDEEDAVISIEELIKRQKQKEKIYNITENEENNSFIDELKQFRKDL